jgi:4-hydroxy-tetrahydrodipicolinate synthase
MNKPCASLGGSIVAIATPFWGTGIDGDALGRLCERQIGCGVAGLAVCGSTGEASSLSFAEHGRVIDIVVEIAAGRVPVIVGCTAVATTTSVTLALSALQRGADALLCAAPPYVKPTQEGVIAHIRAVSQATDLPVMLYDVPSRTGTKIADETVARLFERGLIVAIKDATADLSRPPRLRALCGAELWQLTGDDATQAAYRAMGGHGCVSVSANVAPALCAWLHRAWDSGDLADFARLRDLLAPLHDVLFLESNPIPLKAALAELQLCSGDVRLPLTTAVESTRAALRPVLRGIMRLEDDAALRPPPQSDARSDQLSVDGNHPVSRQINSASRLSAENARLSSHRFRVV